MKLTKEQINEFDKNQSLRNAVYQFVKDFSNIPVSALEIIYPDGFPVEQILTNGVGCTCTEEKLEYYECDCYFYGYPMWSTLFAVNDHTDRDWIIDNLEIVKELGFIVYECDHFGIMLGIDACGTNFYNAYWHPLYRARGCEWHSEIPKTIEEKKASNKDYKYYYNQFEKLLAPTLNEHDKFSIKMDRYDHYQEKQLETFRMTMTKDCIEALNDFIEKEVR